MAVFEYKALNAKGAPVGGIIDADSPADARNKLRQQGVFPTEVVESEEKIGLQSEVTASRLFRRVRPADVAVFSRQLATLLNAGLPLVPALTALIDQLEKSPMKKVVIKVRDQVNAGVSFAEALASSPRVFPPLYSNMVGAGEAAGALEVVMERLADLMEKNIKMTNRIKSIMIYPALVITLGVAVIVFLMVQVVPSIIEIFADSEAALPTPTTILIGVSGYLRSYWLVWLVALGLLFFAFRLWSRRPSGRYFVDRTKLKVPVLGSVFRKLAIVRFSRTLSTLLSSGTSLIRAFDIVKSIVNNLFVAEAIEEAKEMVKAGKSIAEPFRRSRIFPPIVVHMIAVGESSGALEQMLGKVADSYENEVETTVGALISVLEPLMIVVMGLVVGFIVISILLPIFQMSQLIG